MQYQLGNSFWSIWSGNDFPAEDQSRTVFFAPEYVEIEEGYIEHALALALRQTGEVSNLGHAYRTIEGSIVVHGKAAILKDEEELWFMSDDLDEDQVENVFSATWVEIVDGD